MFFAVREGRKRSQVLVSLLSLTSFIAKLSFVSLKHALSVVISKVFFGYW